MNVHSEKVLVLNRAWQPIEETNAATALCDVVRGVATAIDTETMMAMTWAEWLALPVREGDKSLGLVNDRRVRVPSVICKSSYAKMPLRRPKLDRSGIAKRDGKVCQYTGHYRPDGTIDHVVPKSRGGAVKSWQNMVWCSPEINARKGGKLNHEAGLPKLIREPREPHRVPVGATIHPRQDRPEWDKFLLVK